MKPHPSSSWAWKSILYGRDLINSHLSWTVGNGESINLYSDRWIPHFPKPLATLYRSEHPSVSSILSPTQTGNAWNVTKIRDLFTEPIIQKILAIQLPTTSCNDKMVWPHAPSGHYSTKSGYRALYDHRKNSSADLGSQPHLQNGHHIWKTLWHLDLPEHLKVFLWKCARGILPVKVHLPSRLHHSAACPLRATSDESLEHLFLGCPVTQPVWDRSLFSLLTQPMCFREWLMDWIFRLTASLNEKDRFFSFIATLWAIWKTRNATVLWWA